MINTAVEDPERVARRLVRLAQSHRQVCADFLRDHRDGMDTPAVAKFAARIRMFDRVIASASLALSNLPDDNNDRHAILRATIDSMAEDTTADRSVTATGGADARRTAWRGGMSSIRSCSITGSFRLVLPYYVGAALS